MRVKDVEDKLRKANKLSLEINELRVLEENIKDNTQGNYKAHTMYIETEKIKSIKLLSIFNFCCGVSKKQLEIPNSIAVEIREMIRKRISNLEKELIEIL